LAPLIAAIPLGFVYSYAIKWIPIIYLNVLLTGGYGFLFGFLTGTLLRVFKVRNTPLALLCGFMAGIFALYFNWSGHINALVKDAPWFCTPGQIKAIMQVLYEEGSWGFRSGGNVTGITLAIVWVVEALMILGLSTIISSSMVSSLPFCETSQCWLDEEKHINSMEAFSDEEVEALKSGQLDTLSQMRGKVAGQSPFGRLTIKHSDKCDEFCTLSVSNVSITVDKEGSPKESATELVSNLVLPKTMMGFVKSFEHLKPGMTVGA
jgi:hypothetical protein